jgi:hypothetical protein
MAACHKRINHLLDAGNNVFIVKLSQLQPNAQLNSLPKNLVIGAKTEQIHFLSMTEHAVTLLSNHAMGV